MSFSYFIKRLISKPELGLNFDGTSNWESDAEQTQTDTHTKLTNGWDCAWSLIGFPTNNKFGLF